MADAPQFSDARRSALDAYGAFHSAVANPVAATAALSESKVEDRETRARLAVLRTLPAPHPTLPLRLLALIALHARSGALEWTYAIPLTDGLPAPHPLVGWLEQWGPRVEQFYPELRQVVSGYSQSPDSFRPPWEGWSAPPDDRPFGAGRLEWDDALAIARDVAAALGHPQVDAHTLWFVVLREGLFDLQPLLAGAETDPIDALEDALAYASGGVSTAR